ncbi:4a-hydroxytetrahydrobiopterin dehydratase [Williamsia maris]|uniref:Putative pterin-4-alpha-carbinolamine dehydratase n=1 Tax=Williamsia maris TaxID=72806 RepID=A0ABT1HDG0_9NOCA|nr:4a-hydroxytetrahydrobiopterin dehydratase [Williamsia maris]MCP2174916.1 4a-hydroxytetrahydrobiopterin dehydratase [Williamsia maris]
MTDPHLVLSYPEVRDSDLDDWRWLVGVLHARFRTGDLATGLEFASLIGEAAEKADHHPDLDLSYPTVQVRLVSHDVGGVTSRDVDLAREISAIASRLGIAAAPSEIVVLEMALDVPKAADVRDFWAALLDYPAPDDDDQIDDPEGRRTALWFQDSPAASGDVQQRFHYDVIVPPESAADRIGAALAAGGTLVTDQYAPAFWVLADRHGNKACVCTSEGRDE